VFWVSLPLALVLGWSFSLTFCPLASNPPQFLRVFRLGVARLAVFDVFVVPA
jgi:hypothetical protein